MKKLIPLILIALFFSALHSTAAIAGGGGGPNLTFNDKYVKGLRVGEIDYYIDETGRCHGKECPQNKHNVTRITVQKTSDIKKYLAARKKDLANERKKNKVLSIMTVALLIISTSLGVFVAIFITPRRRSSKDSG